MQRARNDTHYDNSSTSARSSEEQARTRSQRLRREQHGSKERLVFGELVELAQ